MHNKCINSAKKRILVTGSSGFLGRHISMDLCREGHQVIGIGQSKIAKQKDVKNFEYIKADISNTQVLAEICQDKQPDVIIHCAGIAHQRTFRPLPATFYDEINHIASMHLAKLGGKINPNIYFIFLSSICVYGEQCSINVDETHQCNPTSAYAESKLSAETALKKLFKKGYLKKLDILRLAPAYDDGWRINLEKRICGPGKWFYIKYGSGQQKLSVLSRKNLVDFIKYRISTDSLKPTCSIMNISDSVPCSFNEMIGLMNLKSIGNRKPIFTVPLQSVNIASKLAQFCFPSKKIYFILPA